MGERLFIGNLPNDTSEYELIELFRAYQVSSLEIKRKKVFNGETVFAYANVPLKRVDKCLQNLNNYHWKNNTLRIEIAKENFMDRLKKERTEKVVKNETEKISKRSFSSYETDHVREDKNVILTFNKDLNDCCDTTEISENADCDLVNKNVENCNISNIPRRGNSPICCDTGNVKCDEIQCSPEKKMWDLTEFSMKNFEEFSDVWKDNLDRKAFRYANETKFTGLTNPQNGKERNAKYVSDLKRKAAVEKKWSWEKEKKNTIRKALKNISSSAECNSNSNLENTSTENTLEKRPNKILFTENSSDEEDDFEPNFELKPYLDGKNGAKMLEMRAKLASDNRFKLDDRFIDSNRNGAIGNAGENNRVLNRPIIYYDPTKQDRKIIEKNLKVSSSKTEKKRKKSMKDEEDKIVKSYIKRPEVSQKKHYIVSDNLKEVFKKTEGKSSFSLTSLFDNWFESDNCTSKVATTSDISQKNLKFIKNPLNNISESESEGDNINEETPIEISSLPKAPEKLLGKYGVWGESFFFKDDDSRLKEAQCFYLPFDEPENKDFSKKRSNLKGIVKKKLQNSKRDKKLFEQKLGGINRTKFNMRLKKVNR